MTINLNTVLTLVALAVAGTSAYFTWQLGLKDELNNLRVSINNNSTNINSNTEKIAAISKNNLPPRPVRTIAQEEASHAIRQFTTDITSSQLQKMPVFHLGTVRCGFPDTFPIPDETTTTDDWVVVGVSPHIDLQLKDDEPHNNALVGFGVRIVPSQNGRQWTVTYNVQANIGITAKNPKVVECVNGTFAGRSPTSQLPEIDIVALRKLDR